MVVRRSHVLAVNQRLLFFDVEHFPWYYVRVFVHGSVKLKQVPLFSLVFPIL